MYRVYVEVPLELIPEVVSTCREVANQCAGEGDGIAVKWLAGVKTADNAPSTLESAQNGMGNYYRVRPDRARVAVLAGSPAEVNRFMGRLFSREWMNNVENSVRDWKDEVWGDSEFSLGEFAFNTEDGERVESLSSNPRPGGNRRVEGNVLTGNDNSFVYMQRDRREPAREPAQQTQELRVPAEPQQEVERLEATYSMQHEQNLRGVSAVRTPEGIVQKWIMDEFGTPVSQRPEATLTTAYLEAGDPRKIASMVQILRYHADQIIGRDEGIGIRWLAGASDASWVELAAIDGQYDNIGADSPQVILVGTSPEVIQRVLDHIQGSNRDKHFLEEVTPEIMPNPGVRKYPRHERYHWEKWSIEKPPQQQKKRSNQSGRQSRSNNRSRNQQRRPSGQSRRRN
jgi:hypothetical protein